MNTPITPASQDLAQRLGIPTLAESLERWASRDDSKAQAEIRGAANVAINAIDSALVQLHQMRSKLREEMRISDDIAMRRVEGLLRAGRAGDGA